MEYAICKLKSINKWKKVYVDQIKSGEIDIKDISGNIICPFCNAEGWFKHKDQRDWHFAFAHNEDCEVITNSDVEHKNYVVVTGENVQEYDIMYKNVYRANKKDANHGEGNVEVDYGMDEHGNIILIGEDDDEELEDIDYKNTHPDGKPKKFVDDIDMVKVFRERNICRPVGLYRLILKLGVYEPILPDGRCGDDILLDDIHLKKIRSCGFEEEKKLAIVTRTGTKLLKHPFNIPKGYSLMRDIYAIDRENSIFFLVKITDEELNRRFQIELMGENGNRENTRNKHRDLLIYHNWKKYPNDFYQVYIADIGNCAYSFVNMAYDKKQKVK